ncbi:hypothetical protein [Aeromonas sobria]|nr:hypothetical protein [Aeromonas sobria]
MSVICKPFKVTLDPDFISGTTNNKFFVDLPSLSPEQKYALASFMKKVEEGSPLPGKNKESWLDDDLDVIPGTKAYQDAEYWHYHCGPTISNGKNFSMTFDLRRNLDGVRSAEVIHYKKYEDEDEIVILAFSPQHIPFPSPKSRFNPLF